jgi:putative proteasome-type protease
MTYCLAISINEGLVFCSDSRTNAGPDQVSAYSKMHRFPIGERRVFVLLSAGNLATAQGVVNQLQRNIKKNAEVSLKTVENMGEAAEYLGQVSRSEQKKHTDPEGQSSFNPSVTLILGGQIDGEPAEVFLIYPEGNFITTSEHSPFLQIGESKYGKPILDRIITPKTSIAVAARCALVSMDSTMRSNVTVGPPIELLLYKKDSFKLDHHLALQAEDAYLLELKKLWDDKIKLAFNELPGFKPSLFKT